MNAQHEDYATALERAAKVIDAAECVTLLCHVNPDGDALGSMLGHAPRAARRRARERRVVLGAVRDRAALPRAPGPRPAHAARTSSPGDPPVMVTFDCGSLGRLGNLRADRRAGARADRRRPPRLERAVRHDQRDRPARRRQRCGRARPHPRARSPADPRRARSASTPRSCATPAGSSTRPPRPRCSPSPASCSSGSADRADQPHAVRGALVRVPRAARRGAGRR